MNLEPYQKSVEQLSESDKRVLIHKGTERPFSGKYTNEKSNGIYTCKICDTPLYKSNDKFDSNCGWPSFDDAIEGAVKRVADADGRRVEIVCATCGGHLGHVFLGEGLTPKNTRHCVNSISIKLDASKEKKDENLSYAYFAGGCFWGVEYYLEKLDGVKEVVSGFMGGHVKNRGYREGVGGRPGHFDDVEGIYDPEGDWITAVLEAVGLDCLISVSFDLHGQVTDKIIKNIDAFAAFKTAPHIDVKDTNRRYASRRVSAINENWRVDDIMSLRDS